MHKRSGEKGASARPKEPRNKKENSEESSSDGESENEMMAPSTEECGKCEKKVTKKQDGVSCEECRVWFHIGCVKISRDEYRVLQKIQSSAWFCRGCLL